MKNRKWLEKGQNDMFTGLHISAYGFTVMARSVNVRKPFENGTFMMNHFSVYSFYSEILMVLHL
jgi:hypothetical protein